MPRKLSNHKSDSDLGKHFSLSFNKRFPTSLIPSQKVLYTLEDIQPLLAHIEELETKISVVTGEQERRIEAQVTKYSQRCLKTRKHTKIPIMIATRTLDPTPRPTARPILDDTGCPIAPGLALEETAA